MNWKPQETSLISRQEDSPANIINFHTNEDATGGFLNKRGDSPANTINFHTNEDTAGGFVKFVSISPEETFNTGLSLAALLIPGSVVALKGDLGSGKTMLAKGIIKGLGINENITSPTYTIISEYQHSPALYHIDVYRLNNDKDFEDIGGPEIINSGGISIIEWSERIPNSIPANAITISLEITGHSTRKIVINGIKSL